MSKSEKKVTIADIISVIGVALMALFVFCGHSLMNYENNLGTNIITSLLFVLGAVVFLGLAVHSKGVENNFKEWMAVECLSLVLFLFVAFFSGQKMLHFFTVYENTDVVKETAREDIGSITGMIDYFSSNETVKLEKNLTGVNTALDEEMEMGSEVSNYMSERGFSDSDALKEYRKLMKNKIDNIIDKDEKSFKIAWSTEKNEIDNIIENWNIVKLPEAAKRLRALNEGVGAKLTEVSASFGFVEIAAGNDTLLRMKKVAPDSYSYNIKFASAIKEPSEPTVMGVVAVVGINLLILSSYIFAYRSRKVAPKGKKTLRGGAPLN